MDQMAVFLLADLAVAMYIEHSKQIDSYESNVSYIF